MQSKADENQHQKWVKIKKSKADENQNTLRQNMNHSPLSATKRSPTMRRSQLMVAQIAQFAQIARIQIMIAQTDSSDS